MRRAFLLFVSLLPALPAFAETITVTPQEVTEWKPVYAEVEPRDEISARARIGGTLLNVDVTEGDVVREGQRIALVEDSKLQLQIEGVEAQLTAYRSQLEQAQDDLTRGQSLSERGVISSQNLQSLQTNLNVLLGQISSLEANRQVLSRQIEEGEVIAPSAGMVLDVPVITGGVIMAGEEVARIGAGQAFLRLGVSERYADSFSEGDTILVTENGETKEGRLAKIYPLIEGGRVEADVEVDGLDARFVGRRIAVRLPVGSRSALLVPEVALRQSGGLDFVTVSFDGREMDRAVVPGDLVTRDGVAMREILSGLKAGDMVVTSNE